MALRPKWCAGFIWVIAVCAACSGGADGSGWGPDAGTNDSGGGADSGEDAAAIDAGTDAADGGTELADAPDDGSPDSSYLSDTSHPSDGGPDAGADAGFDGGGPVPIATLVGMEYAGPTLAQTFAGIGFPAVKYLPAEYNWGKMQPKETDPINFAPLDRYVSEYQGAGFSALVVGLKTDGNTWALKAQKNLTPKPEYVDDYERWVGAVVERYDGDGVEDMPGLLHPVRHYEIGVEFSSYEPEPVADYIEMLERAYNAAHAADADVIVCHAAILATTAFRDHPGPAEYDAAFSATDTRVMYHSLVDIRAILDRPQIFDAVNFHALGDPYEIEETVRWLEYEMGLRGYFKPLLISDTAPSPLISWGPATSCTGDPAKLGIIIPPAVEADRCRLADYFADLVDGDEPTVRWTQTFTAADMVKKVVVAVHQGLTLMDTSFMEDLTPMKAKWFQAAAGTSPWGGMVLTDVNIFTGERTIREVRASFFAQRQLAGHLAGKTHIERMDLGGPDARVYRLTGGSPTATFVAWYDPPPVALPGDPVPSRTIALPTSRPALTVEHMISEFGQETPVTETVVVENSAAQVVLGPNPVYVFVTP
ncbi:MAG: hypothetical protein HY897_00225 [Deltaproteobacteria bacterium]|nr:hypothetical protein [Deltaproteobacteria bacterium]